MSVATRRRVRVRVQGTVQGVGFRPYVHRLAGELDLTGYVLNDSRGVLLEVEGDSPAVERFLARLAPEAPPLAVVERVAVDPLVPSGPGTFEIRPSAQGEAADAPVAPDSTVCVDCLRELMDPGDRRHRYPFINCTACGPRFTIVRGVPYDRPLTTMAGFQMCSECRAEYDDPSDRRFHAQPNACPRCGPSVLLVSSAAPDAPLALGDDAVREAAGALRAGRILAVKGIGGFHLACRADDEAAVAALRARKHREDKPFALMVASLAAADPLVVLGELERALLCGPQRPIVLARRRDGAPVARVGRARRNGAGTDAPLHAASPPADRRRGCGGAGDDQRQRVRRADRVRRRRRGGAAERDRRPPAAPRPADPDPDRRLGRAGGRGAGAAPAVPAALARLRAGRDPAARRHAAAAAGLRRRAQEHVLPRQGRARVGRSPHRRPGELRDAASRSPRGSSTSKRCSRSRPRSSPTICTPSTCRPSTRSGARTCG